MEDVKRTFVPPTSFVSSPDMEKERFLYLATSLAEGFYSRHQFLITPMIVPEYKQLCVVVPEILKKASWKFWDEAKKGGQTMPKILSKLMWEEFKNEKFFTADQNVIKSLENGWKVIETKYWEFINKIFPEEIRLIGSLEVRLTKIGSLGTHYLLSKKIGQKLVINVREDANLSTMASLIILALVYTQKDKLDLSFNKRTVLRDFLMGRKEMKELFPKWNRLSYENVRVPEALRRQSEAYIEKLGIPRLVDPVEIIEKNWPIFGDKEAKFLKLLIKNRGEQVSYDQIADEVWGDGEFKTYWAINKIYQRVEKKIRSLGIEVSGIKGIRGRGYKLT